MKKVDYEKLVKHIDEWDKNNVAYSLKDMKELEERYSYETFSL